MRAPHITDETAVLIAASADQRSGSAADHGRGGGGAQWLSGVPIGNAGTVDLRGPGWAHNADGQIVVGGNLVDPVQLDDGWFAIGDFGVPPPDRAWARLGTGQTPVSTPCRRRSSTPGRRRRQHGPHPYRRTGTRPRSWWGELSLRSRRRRDACCGALWAAAQWSRCLTTGPWSF